MAIQRIRRAIGVIVLLLLGCMLFSFAYLDGVFFVVPDQRDPNLVGAWTGTWKAFGAKSQQLVFLADGTARVANWGPVKWGTSHGVLYIKYRSAGEGWGTGEATYQAALGDHMVSFRGRPSVIIPSRMARR